jgi:ribosomal protein L29
MYNERKKEQFNLRVQRKFNQLSNTARMRACRCEVAQILTRMNQLKAKG